MADQPSISPDPSADIFCSVLSRELGEPLYATALHNETWLLLEYDGVWREKATSDNDLPHTAQAWLDKQAALCTGRVQFIRQERRWARDFLSFFLIRASEMQPRMLHFKLDDYGDLLDLDVREILADEERFAECEHFTPLYLVCTNGRRDRCCALFGLETYYALGEVAGTEVWQTTHVSGHRFAANVVTFPDGTYFGRVSTANASAFYEARERGEIMPELLRGRSCYEPVVQAADYYLRRETGRMALFAFELESLESLNADRYRVTLRDLGDEISYRIDLQSQPSDLALYASCGALQLEPPEVYRLHAIRKMIAG